MILPGLQLFDDRAAQRSAAGQMALDEALLELSAAPVLRVYRWSVPVLSFGYFLSFADAAAEQSAHEGLMRRWTGGGLVHHGADVPWSLVVPRVAEEALQSTRGAYAALHSALAAALEKCGTATAMHPPESPAPTGGLCFQAPAPGDLLGGDGRKLAGAGQRRTRLGLLHQGTIHGVNLPAHFPSLLAASLADSVQPFHPPSGLEARAAELETCRYSTPGWLRLR